MKFTVIGAGGLIGGTCVRHLLSAGHEVLQVYRETVIPDDMPLGNVIFAIGLTGDFRGKPFETVDAHVTILAKWLRFYKFDSFLYLSSTRIYEGSLASSVVNEITPLTFLPDANRLYDLTKLTGETLCLSHPSKRVRIARIANVYAQRQGTQNFLGAVLDSLRTRQEVVIYEDPESSKDYVALSDVVQVLLKIAIDGKQRIYNVASGVQITHRELTGVLQNCGDFKISFANNSPVRRFPIIDIERVREEFGMKPRMLLDDLTSGLVIRPIS